MKKVNEKEYRKYISKLKSENDIVRLYQYKPLDNIGIKIYKYELIKNDIKEPLIIDVYCDFKKNEYYI